MTTFQDVVEFIDQASETEIHSVWALCKQRQKMLRAAATVMNLSTLNVGDVVVINGISPKYLNGETATVVNLHGSKPGSVQVRLNKTRVGKFNDISPIGIPASCLTLA